MERILIIADCLDVVSPTGDAALLAANLLAESMSGAEVTVQVWQLSDMQVSPSLAGVTTNIPWPNRFCSRTVSAIRKQAKSFAATRVVCFGDNAITAGAICKLRSATELVAVHCVTQSLVNGRLTLKRRWQLSQVDRHLVGHASAVEQLSQRFPAWRIAVMPRLRRNSVSVDRQQIKRELAIPEDAKLVVTAAPMTPEFRLKDFIWACDLVTCIRDDVYWLLIGQGPMRWRLKRFQDCLQIGEHLRYRDWSSSSLDLVAASDFYLQTSAACPSACGLATAISLGKPCVASKEAAHRELIKHGASGYLVERSARNEFARCVNRLVNEPAIAARFSELELRVAEHEFGNVGVEWMADAGGTSTRAA